MTLKLTSEQAARFNNIKRGISISGRIPLDPDRVSSIKQSIDSHPELTDYRLAKDHHMSENTIKKVRSGGYHESKI